MHPPESNLSNTHPLFAPQVAFWKEEVDKYVKFLQASERVSAEACFAVNRTEACSTPTPMWSCPLRSWRW